ncbi:unnamed protein product [Adineta ricciae]|uniref:Uncharacterized protein n=1 Tax=Adineta ricciae TaxID=249248 RepID=A0A816D7A9_ADIRI|nr:unnamed protein product [Adineta ricciae]CAF1630983.1 unnamed protein product [Adineta ricciae]
MLNPDLLDDSMVKAKLKNGELVMVMNTKYRTSTWSDLRLLADAKYPEAPLIGWAVISKHRYREKRSATQPVCRYNGLFVDVVVLPFVLIQSPMTKGKEKIMGFHLA